MISNSVSSSVVFIFILINLAFSFIADSENDSGYGTTTDFMPLMKLLSSNSLNKDLKMAGKFYW